MSLPFSPPPSHQLDADSRRRVDLVQVEDELRQVLDGVDVVVGGGRDQRHPGLRRAQGRDVLRDLRPRELAALPGLGALAHLDLNLAPNRNGRQMGGGGHGEKGVSYRARVSAAARR